MKKILYISPYEEFILAQNGGYGVIAESFKKMFDIIENIEVTYININELSMGIYKNIVNKYDICIILTHPLSFENKIVKQNIEQVTTSCIKIYLHLFWETIPLPSKWKWLWASNLFTGFISPSKFIYDMIKDEIKGTNKENHLIYCPIFKDDFSKYKIKIENKNNENIFTVLYIGQYTKRKGMEDAIIGFLHALSQYKDCRLILKYHPLSNKELEIPLLLKTLVSTNSKEMKAKIYEITQNLNKDEIYSLYTESSILLFPSRGEGFGLPLIEAGMIGLPCIYTNWSSTIETGKFKGNKSISCILDTAQGMSHYEYESNSIYAIPSIKDIIKNLRDCYNMWKLNKQEYYMNTNNNDLEIIKKFGKKNFIEQINKLIGE